MKPTRHPAVIDTLGGSPGSGARTSKASKPAKPPKAPRSTKADEQGKRPSLWFVAALLVVVALLGWSLIRVFAGPDTETPVAGSEESTAATTSAEIPLAVTPPAATTEPVADPNECRTDTGDQKSGAGVIAAFEHAYYVARSGAAVRALATPETSLPLAEKIQSGIDTVPTGTAHCVRITPIATGVYSVVLAEMQPGQAPSQFPQTITTKDIGGRWFVDSIS